MIPDIEKITSTAEQDEELETEEIDVQELESYFQPSNNEVDDEVEIAKILNRIDGE